MGDFLPLFSAGKSKRQKQKAKARQTDSSLLWVWKYEKPKYLLHLRTQFRVVLCQATELTLSWVAGTKGERSRGRGRERGKPLTCWAKKKKKKGGRGKARTRKRLRVHGWHENEVRRAHLAKPDGC